MNWTATPITAELEGDRISVNASFLERDAIKQISGSRYDGSRDVWTVPASWGACVALRSIFQDRLLVGPDLTVWSQNEYAARVYPSLTGRTRTETEASFHLNLRGFQQAGVEWMNHAGDVVLGDGLGAGKTVQTVVALETQGWKTGVVVCPLSVVKAWVEHFDTWTNLKAVSIASPMTPTKRRAVLAQLAAGEINVVVMNWDLAKAHTSIAAYPSVALTDKEREPKELDHIALDFVVADEAHKMREPKNVMTRALWKMGDGAKRRIALTGTPIGNRLDELWAIMRFVAPNEWPTKSKWVDRFCETSFSRWGALEVGNLRADRQEEFYKVWHTRYRAMPKEVVLRDLPPVRGGIDDPAGPVIRWCRMTPKQAKAYKEIRDNSVADLDGQALMALTPLARLTRLLQLASSFGSVENLDAEDADGNPVVRQKLVLEKPSCKIDTLVELLEGELSGEECLIVFTTSSQLAVMAQEAATTATNTVARIVIGGQSGDERAMQIAGFQNGDWQPSDRKKPRKGPGVIVVVASAGGTGTTLTRARTAVHLQRSYSYIDRKQCEGRYHRIGSEVHDLITTIDVVTEDTCELAVLEALQEKRDLSEVVTQQDQLRALLLATH
jgi:SNF2 family DNA or RNA helicase